MGQTGQTLATFKLTTGAPEAVNVTKLVITDTMVGTSTAATGSVTNLKLFNAAGTQVGSTVTSMAAGATATFDGLTYQVAKDKSEILTLKGDINGYPNAVSGSGHIFKVAGSSTTDVISAGATTGTQLTNANIVVTSATAATSTVYRAELTAANAMSNVSNAVPSANQQIGKYTFTNTSPGNYSITVTGLTLNMSSTLGNATSTITIKKGSVDGTTLATASIAGAPFANTTFTLTSFTIDASNGTGAVDIYVLADTNNVSASTYTGKTITTSVSTTGATWTDGVSTGINSMDGSPIYGANTTY